MKILHFADAHIDMMQSGRLDPATGLPIRVNDFLRSMDAIIDAAINEKVDMVIFAGDAYKDRTPAPTYQREFAKRIFKLSTAKIPTLLLVGNHDVSPATGRANTLHEFDTLAVPYVRVSSTIEFLKPADLWGLPLQIITVPWINQSAFLAASGEKIDKTKVGEEIEERVTNIIMHWLDDLDPALPAVLTAHASVQGAVLGNERAIMLGKDMVMPGYLVKDQRLDYVALGHIHKYQDINDGHYPPVIYPGSIERVDFGEIYDEKCYVLANVEKGATTFNPVPLITRNFIQIDYAITADNRLFFQTGAEGSDSERKGEIATGKNITENIIEATKVHFGDITGAIIKLVLTYPYEIEATVNDSIIMQNLSKAFEVHIVRRPIRQQLTRLTQTAEELSKMTELDLFTAYIDQQERAMTETERASLISLASEIMLAVNARQKLKYTDRSNLTPAERAAIEASAEEEPEPEKEI